MPPHEELVIELCVPCTRYPNRQPKNERLGPWLALTVYA
jgi:hypothetical protein